MIKKIHFLIVGILVLVTCKIVFAQSQNKLQDAVLKEISGLVSSGINKNILYVHNDSGDTSRFFAITPQGKLQTTFYFKANNTQSDVNVVDCEDIAVGPGPAKNKSYIYLADIGDNKATRNAVTVYRFAEPTIKTDEKTASIDASTIHLKYPDGAHDAETLMIDPIEKQMYIITKREDSVGVYTAPLNASLTDTTVLEKRGKIHFKGLPLFKWITAGDVSADGSQVLLRSYQKVYYWKRPANEPLWKTLQRKPAELPHQQEKQGEAIGFTLDGKGFYTTSEGLNVPIYYYNLPK